MFVDKDGRTGILLRTKALGGREANPTRNALGALSLEERQPCIIADF